MRDQITPDLKHTSSTAGGIYDLFYDIESWA